jgi:hypothetical protein
VIGLVTVWLAAGSLLAQRPVTPQPPAANQRPTRARHIVQDAPGEGRTRRVVDGKVNARVALHADAVKCRSLFLGALAAR